MARGLVRRFDDAAVGLARRVGILAVRMALGVVFIWFGGLKVADASPVAGLVADVIPILSDRTAVVVVGAVEIVVGLGLITGWAIRLTLAVFFVQMIGTFAILVTQPSLSFDGANPLRLTVLGEFVVKNLVLLTAGLVVAATIPRPRPDGGITEMLAQRAEPEGEITTSPRG